MDLFSESGFPLPVVAAHRERVESPSAIEVTEAMIRRLVETFYARIAEDAVLGPVFMSEITDWPSHLVKMRDFWSAVVLQTGRYAGRPMEKHLRLEMLAPADFDRWLGLWADTVESTVPGPCQDRFVIPAERMARTMKHRMFG